MLSYEGWTDPITLQPLDPEFLSQLVFRQLGRATYKVGGKLRVVDTNLAPIDMHLPGSEDVADLSRSVYPETASITLDATQPVMRQISWNMLDPLFDPAFGTDLEFDPFTQFVQPTMILSAQGKTFECPLGTYFVGEPKGTIRRGRRIYQFTGLDLTALIALADLMSDWTVTAGYTGGHLQALLDLFTSDSVPKSLGGKGATPQGNDDAGPAWPIDVFDVDWTGNQPVAIPFPWRAGTNRMQNAGEITSAINYYPLTMSNQTKFRLWRMPDFTTTMPTVTADYSTTGKSIVTNQDIGQEFARSPNAANIIRVEGGQSTGAGSTAPFVSLQANDSPDSKMSYQNLRTLGGRPRAISRYENVPNLANQAMTDEYAKQKLNAGDILQDALTIVTLPDPMHEWPEYVKAQITMKNGTVIVASDDQHPYLEMGWTLPWMSPKSRMSHTLIRLAAY